MNRRLGLTPPEIDCAAMWVIRLALALVLTIVALTVGVMV